jgi:hypothetical protein
MDPEFYKFYYLQQPSLVFYQTLNTLNYLEKKSSTSMKKKILTNFKKNLLICISKEIELTAPLKYPKDI